MRKKNGAYANNMGIVSIVPLTDGTAKLELINGAVYQFHLQKDDSGNVVRLQNRSVDYEKMSRSEIFANYIALGLPAISFAVMLILLLVHLLTIKKSRQEGCRKFRIAEILVGVSVLLLGADLYYFMQMDVSGRADMIFPCVALMALDALMAGGILACHCIKKKPTSRVGLTLETVCSAMIIAGTLYWKLYQFWGY